MALGFYRPARCCWLRVGVSSLRGFDVFGTLPLRAALRGTTLPPSVFVARGPYRYVRHPLYLFMLLLIWSTPRFSTDRFLFNVLWTAWIIIGTKLEERDLLVDSAKPTISTKRRYQCLYLLRAPCFAGGTLPPTPNPGLQRTRASPAADPNVEGPVRRTRRCGAAFTFQSNFTGTRDLAGRSLARVQNRCRCCQDVGLRDSVVSPTAWLLPEWAKFFA